jgi:hypothetical protein
MEMNRGLGGGPDFIEREDMVVMSMGQQDFLNMRPINVFQNTFRIASWIDNYAGCRAGIDNGIGVHPVRTYL